MDIIYAFFQASSCSSLDLRKCCQQQEHPWNCFWTAQKEFCQISLETGIPCDHRYPSNAKDGPEQQQLESQYQHPAQTIAAPLHYSRLQCLCLLKRYLILTMFNKTKSWFQPTFSLILVAIIKLVVVPQ